MVVNNWYATVPGFGVMSDAFDLHGNDRQTATGFSHAALLHSVFMSRDDD